MNQRLQKILQLNHLPNFILRWSPLPHPHLKSPPGPETPSTPAIQIDEGIRVEVDHSSIIPEASPPKSTCSRSHSGKDPSNSGPTSPQLSTTPTRNMDSSVHMLDHEVYRWFEMPGTSRAEPTHFNQFLGQAAEEILSQIISPTAERYNPQDIDLVEIPHVSHETVAAGSYPGTSQPSLSITMQEILTLTSVLERIRHTYLIGEEVDPNQSLSLMIVDENASPPLIASSSQEDTPAQAASEEAQAVINTGNPIASGKDVGPSIPSQGQCSRNILC